MKTGTSRLIKDEIKGIENFNCKRHLAVKNNVCEFTNSYAGSSLEQFALELKQYLFECLNFKVSIEITDNKESELILGKILFLSKNNIPNEYKFVINKLVKVEYYFKLNNLK